MTEGLKSDEFSEFFTAVHGHDPFPWQAALAERVFAEGWPEGIDVPTAAGKTAVLDIAVFHLALEAANGATRRAPVRVLFVVDRRLIVEAAFERADRIARALVNPQEDILRRVIGRLALLAEQPDLPLMVTRLRGGIPQDQDWVRTPAQPMIIVSTVDQVGSRLLFRGYGVSPSMRPVHAGLVGADALLILDEAHLSSPFLETARDSRRFERPSEDGLGVTAPFACVSMSATRHVAGAFSISAVDTQHPILGPRLNVSKPVTLVELGCDSTDPMFVVEFAKQAMRMSRAGGGSATIVAVIVNRVGRARAIFEELLTMNVGTLADASGPGEHDTLADAALLIGRTRELDRDITVAAVLRRTRATRRERLSDRPLFVIATQCLEAGVDIDFEALVTEIAPLDSLRQRFGRLDRFGEGGNAAGSIVAAKDQTSSKKDDAIYGAAVGSTWQVIKVAARPSTGRRKNSGMVIDFGVVASLAWLPTGGTLSECLAPTGDAPMLLPAAIEAWSRTSPSPAADPPVELYLHGPNAKPADVQVIWREDLHDDETEFWAERVAVCPPSALESIAVPIWETLRWLRGGATGDITDLEAASDAGAQGALSLPGRSALRWRGWQDSGTRVVAASEIRPGDVIVIPGARGGCDRWGWAPQSLALVHDYGREANFLARDRDIVRLSLDSVSAKTSGSEILEDMSDIEVLRAFAASGSGWRVKRNGLGLPLALERHLPSATRAPSIETAGEAVTESDESLRGAQRAVSLSEHSVGVEALSSRYATQLGLSSALVRDIGLAGFLHDAGKAHPAFKRFLYGGDELRAAAGPDLAKSQRLPSGIRQWERICNASGLPPGARHEVASVQFAQRHPRYQTANDPDLVLWLIGTHHGRGRPFFPGIDWPIAGDVFSSDLGGEPVSATVTESLAELTGPWVDLFARLSLRYGPWNLARLEGVLRLADHRRSEEEQVAAAIVAQM